MNADDTREDKYFDGFDDTELHTILERQEKVIQFQKSNKDRLCI